MNIKKAIIIGASSGIGKGISLELLNKGYKIAISARRKERLDEIKKLNPDMVIVKEYDSSTEKNDELIKNLIDKLNGVDLIIYCSGIGIINKELDYSLEKKVNNLNVSGFTQVVDYAFNYFLKRGEGHERFICPFRDGWELLNVDGNYYTKMDTTELDMDKNY